MVGCCCRAKTLTCLVYEEELGVTHFDLAIDFGGSIFYVFIFYAITI